MPEEYKRGQEPWNKWRLVYICKQCGKHTTEAPGAELLAALDLMKIGGKEPTHAHMLQFALNGKAPASVAHECDSRAVGQAELCGVIREGSRIVVAS